MDRYQPYLFQPVESRLGYSISGLLEEVRAAWFPDIDDRIEVRFHATGPLAYIANWFMGPTTQLVVFHPVLNHPGTPAEVLRFIAKHELTHIVRPPRTIGGEYESHPPEFWAHEAAVGPERRAVWRWVHQSLRSCAFESPRGFRVDRRWRALTERQRTPFSPELPFNGEQWDRACPGEGSQLRLPPDWAPRPLPLA